jgi:uncharacterized protein (TIGR01777 family)
MRILVTGGTGFIGRALCRRLLADGNAVGVLSRQPATFAGLFGAHAQPIEFPIQTADIEGYDAVVNLAGAPIFGPRWSTARKQLLRDSRVQLTEQLVGRLGQLSKPPRVLLSGSAIGYYGDHGATAVDETASPSNGFSHELCAAWELAGQRAVEFGMRVCTLRTGVVLGPDGGLLQRMSVPFRLGLGGRLGDGRQWMSWIHLEDHLNAMLHLLQDPRASGPFNLTAPNPVTNGAFTEALARLLRRPAFLHLPAPLLRLLFGEMSELLLASQKVLPKRLTEQTDLSFRFPTLTDALADCLKAT